MTHEVKLTQRQKRLLRSIYAASIVTGGLITATARAQDRVWDGSSDNDWNVVTNWTEEVIIPIDAVPDTASETAVFNALGAGQPTVDLDTSVTIAGVRFESTAPSYNIVFGNNRDMTLADFGILNESNSQQTFSLSSNNSDLIFDSDDATVVGGPAGVVINNAGANVSFNLDSDAGNVTINNSTNGADLIFNDTSSAANATINNTNRGRVTFEDGSDAGDAVINNTGTVNQNSIVQFAENSDSGTAFITNNNNGQTIFSDDSTAGRFNSNDPGSARTEIINYAGGSTLFEDQASAQNAIIQNVGGTTTFDTSGTNGSTGDAAGAGTSQITNTLGGDLIFEGTSNAQNATIVNDGVGSSTTFDNNTGAGSAQITNRNFGSTVFNGANAENAVITNENTGSTTLNSNSTGPNYLNGGLIVNEPGGTTTIHSGANVENTRILNDGLVVITNGGTAEIGSIDGSGDINLNTSTLEIGALGLEDEISGVISGGNPANALTKVGSGNLTLSGASTYTGNTTVEDGILTLTGSITSDTTVETNGTLSGNGSIFGTLVVSGGTLRPGSMNENSLNRYDQLFVGGDVDLDNGATFITNVRGEQNSLLVSTGEVEIGAANLTADIDGGFGLRRQYTVIVADDIDGTFDNAGDANNPTVTIIDGDGNIVGYAYREDNVNGQDLYYLVLQRTATDFQEIGGLTPNQSAIARALDEAYEDDFPNWDPDRQEEFLDRYNDFYEAIFTGDVRRNLSIASGDAHSVFPVAAQGAARRFLERLLSQTQQQAGQNQQLAAAKAPRLVYSGTHYRELLAQATAQPVHGTIGEADAYHGHRSNVWATIGRAREDADSDGNGPGFDARATEYQVGFSRRISPRTVLALSLGKSDGRVDINDRQSNGDIDTTSIGASIRHDNTKWYFAGGLAYNRHRIDSERELGGLEYDASYRARTIELAGEIGRKLVRGGWSIEPNISVNIANTRQDGFEENGPGGALDADSSSYNTRRLGLGVRVASRDINARFRPYLFVGYQREFGDRRVELTNSLTGLGAFNVEGTELGRNIFKLRLGADARINDRFSLIGEIGASWRSNQDSQYIFGGVKYGW